MGYLGCSEVISKVFRGDPEESQSQELFRGLGQRDTVAERATPQGA